LPSQTKPKKGKRCDTIPTNDYPSIHVRVPRALKERVTAKAKEKNVSIGVIVRFCLYEGLKQL